MSAPNPPDRPAVATPRRPPAPEGAHEGQEAARRWNRDLRNTVRDATGRAEAAADCFKKQPGTPKAPDGR